MASLPRGWHSQWMARLLSSEALFVSSELYLGFLTVDGLPLTSCHRLIPGFQLYCFGLLLPDEEIYVDLIFFSLWVPKILVSVMFIGN